MADDFLESRIPRSWTSDRTGNDCDIYLGNGGNALEVVVTEVDDRPRKDFLQRLYRDRRSQRINPVLVVAFRDDRQTVDVCGAAGEDPDVKRDLDPAQVERICETALDQPDHHAAQRFLDEILTQIDDELVGLRNQGLLSTHELKAGVPERDDWDSAVDRASGLLEKESRGLVEELGYEIERLSDQSYVLKDVSDGRDSAVAVFLQDHESFDHAQDRFTGQTPISYALSEADQKNLDYVIASSNSTLRLYTTNPEAGFGSRGRTDTFVEVNTNLLTDENAGYLPLLFSAEALRDEGTLHDIMEDSKDYAAELGRRLRERIYDEVIPDLAEAIADARELEDPTKEELDRTYRMSLVQLYRLLFIAYAEDEGFLPRYNPRYEKRSLKSKAHELHDLRQEGVEFDDRSTTHWDDVMELSRAIHDGHSEWSLPEYDGRLLSEDPDISEAGAELAEIELTDDQFGPVLANLLIDETEDEFEGPVDFRNIGVREFGVIYEGLLESELSLAEQPLTVDDEGHYVPVDTDGQQTLGKDNEDVVVPEGQVYLHGQSGERKATGTYYTKTRFVEHLLDYSLDPALEDHIERLDRLREEEGRQAAANAFFDIRVADIAMGSGHFLVGAIDRIESRLMAYLSRDDVTLPQVEDELDRLRDAAEDAFETAEEMPEVERSQLLRRQVARRCIYGVDVNDLSTELARLSMWVHTFVPGLPLAFLDYNLTTGDSLAGIGTLEEVSDILDVDQTNLGMFMGGTSVMKDIEGAIDDLGRYADADAKQVAEARETRKEIEDELAQTRAAFDILAASRIDEEIDPEVVNDDGVDLLGSEEYEMAQDALESTNPLHFPTAFPEVFGSESGTGFDVVVGNPPWEKAKVERHAFWSRHYPGLRGLTQRERDKRIDELEEERPDLVADLRQRQLEAEKRASILTNGPYEGLGSGDPDMYQAFSWRFWHVLSENGEMGLVLPREAFMAKGSEEFRRETLENGAFEDVTFVKNKARWAFQMEPRYTIGLAAIRKSKPGPEETVPIRGPFADPEEFDEGVESEPYRFTVKEVDSWTDVCAFPLLPPEDGSISAFDQLQESPRLTADEGDWNIVPYRTGITSSDCLSIESPEETDNEVWPVYKGESFDVWKPDTGSYYGWGDRDELVEHLEDKRSRSRKWPDTTRELPCFRPTIGFRRVTRATDSRTVRASLLPPKVFMRDADPIILWSRGEKQDEAYLIGVLSSIPTDWYARRFVEKHLDYYIFNGIPVPRPSRDSDLRQRVVELSGRLAAVDDRYAGWADAVGVDYGPLDEDEKQEMIHELDAVVAHLYGLSRDNLQVVFETFHDNWDHEPRMNAVLEHYDDWEAKLD